jgi:hypothetical protein
MRNYICAFFIILVSIIIYTILQQDLDIPSYYTESNFINKIIKEKAPEYERDMQI